MQLILLFAKTDTVVIVLGTGIIAAALFYFMLFPKPKTAWKYYKELAVRLNGVLEIRESGFFNAEFPEIKGQIGDEFFSVTLHAEASKPPQYFTKINLETVRIPGFNFSIGEETLLLMVAKKAWAKDIEMNHKAFDAQFMVVSSDEEIMRLIFSEDSCALMTFHGNEKNPELKFEDGLMRYQEKGIINSKEDVDRIDAIVHMMQNICEKMRVLKDVRNLN